MTDAVTRPGENFSAEVRVGRRFRFGRNWAAFLKHLDENRIREAERSLQEMLGQQSFSGQTFLDVGSGSGLFSLAARRLGASVRSFDFDVDSVSCTRALRDRYYPGDSDWMVEEASVLDPPYMESLGSFDITYAWGVLHHTGRMYDALTHACATVRPGGRLFLMIYLDRGLRSRMWRVVKRTYCAGTPGQVLILATALPYLAFRQFVSDLKLGNNPFKSSGAYSKNRGMSRFHDWIDWLGGYPFEFARPDEVVAFCRDRGFEIQLQRGAEYVFRRL